MAAVFSWDPVVRVCGNERIRDACPGPQGSAHDGIARGYAVHRHMKLSLLAAAIGAMMTHAWAHARDGADSGRTGELMAGPEAAAGIPVLTGPRRHDNFSHRGELHDGQHTGNFSGERALTGVDAVPVPLWPSRALPPMQNLRSVGLYEIAPVDPIGDGMGGAPEAHAVNRFLRRHLDTSDGARLLADLPEVHLQGAGGLSSLPFIRGLGADRLRLVIDDQDVTGVPVRALNPVLSHLDPQRVRRLYAWPGVAPVSVGGDSIGGGIVIETAGPRFADGPSDPLSGGHWGAHYRTNGQGIDFLYGAYYATDALGLRYQGGWARSQNVRAGGNFKAAGAGRDGNPVLRADEIGSSSFRAQHHQLAVAWTAGTHMLEAEIGWESVPFQGLPTQRLDLTDSEAGMAGLRYRGMYGWGDLKARVWHQRIRNHLDAGRDRALRTDGLRARNEGTTDGVRVQADVMQGSRDILRLGVEGLSEKQDTGWQTAAARNTVWTLDDGRRERVGGFAEWERNWNADWSTLVGVRYTRVTTRAGAVSATGPLDGWATDAAAFNAATRETTDNHGDFSALASYAPRMGHRYELGLARATRSPSLAERYGWSTSALAAGVAGLPGDGNGFVGNPALKPEVANTISATASWEDPTGPMRWGMSVTAWASRIRNHVDVARCVEDQCGSGNADATGRFVMLRTVNQNASTHGMDLRVHRGLGDRKMLGDAFVVHGQLSWMRGRNDVTDDNLYGVMPGRLRLALEMNWSDDRLGLRNTLEWEGVQARKRLSAVRNEVRTPGYGLIHWRNRLIIGMVGLDFGIENLLDRRYTLTGGEAWVGQGNTTTLNSVPWGVAMPGPGRTYMVGLTYRF